MIVEYLEWMIGAVASVVLVAWLGWRRRAGRSERASRPRELAHAELVHMEKLFRIRHPIRLAAKLDRAYRQPDGTLVLVELKTRRSDRVHLSDIIQLSAQRLAVKEQTGQAVAEHAFVTVERSEGSRARRSHRVRLLEDSEVVSLARRRAAILAGRAEATFARSSAACEGCAYRRECPRSPGA